MTRRADAGTDVDGDPLAAELERAAAYRRALRRFLTRTRVVARRSRLTPQRYELLLNVKASPEEQMTVGEIADALSLAPSTATELIQRSEEAGLVRRKAAADARVSIIELSPEGESRLMEMFLALRADREAMAEAFRAVDRGLRAVVEAAEVNAALADAPAATPHDSRGLHQ